MAAAGKRVRADASTSDLLSALPDNLLHRILSFLPSQQVVQTSVLSRRWAPLWRSARCIDISIRGFTATAADGSSDHPEPEEKWEKMEDFTTNLLILHNAPDLDAFRLEMDSVSAVRLRAFDLWVRRGVMYSPSALEVAVLADDCGVPYQLPRLGGAGSGRLKRLQLRGVSLDGSFADQLSSRCPVLEDLELLRCDNRFRQIQSNTLKKLFIHGSERSMDMLVIRAPALASLRLGIPYSIHGGGVSLHGSTNSLANLELTGFSATVYRPPLVSLPSIFVVMQDKVFDKFPILDNLRTLSLGGCLPDESDVDSKFEALGRFLQRAPNLEKLTLQHASCWVSAESKSKKRKTRAGELSLHTPDQNVFQCQKLKLIEIKYQGRHSNDADHQLFQIMWGLWMNLQRVAFILTKI